MSDQVEPFEEPEAKGSRASRLRNRFTQSLTRLVSAISVDADREAAIAWLVEARGVLIDERPLRVKTRCLFRMVNSREAASVIGRAAKEALLNYGKADLPLAIKVATPVAAVGAARFGLQGAGIAAFGSAVGLPVVVILFLGTAGITSVLEAFAKDKRIASPHAQLVLGLIALEAARRYRKAFLVALQQAATIPRKAELPSDEDQLLDHLRTMHPTDFERHVMSFFNEEGRQVGVTPQSNDFGVDGFVIDPDGIIVVQCKRNSETNRVGRPIVQQFKGVVEEQNAKLGYIVTTSDFTTEARQSASKTEKVVLIDSQLLLDWHRNGTSL